MNHAWAAGIFSGEGCTTLNTPTSVRLTVANTNLELLERFRMIVGCGSIHARAKHPPNRKDRYEWRANRFEDVLLTLNRMWDWLTEEKRAQARVALSRRVYTMWSRVCTHCGEAYVPTGTGQRYCDTRCRGRARWQRIKGGVR